jgi:mono/diheme cytochrome c family protein
MRMPRPTIQCRLSLRERISFRGAKGDDDRRARAPRSCGKNLLGGGVRIARAIVAVQLLTVPLFSGCRSEMYDQPRYKPYHASGFFDDGTSARPLVAGTVAQRDPNERGKASAEHFDTGKTGGKLAEVLPLAVDRAVLERGQERFRIFCTPCHGELGDGRGMIVQRGFNPPPSFHSDEVRKKPVGHYFDVMTRGFGTMYSYASRIQARDRWAIAAYIRALQLSQHSLASQLPPEDRSQLQGEQP